MKEPQTSLSGTGKAGPKPTSPKDSRYTRIHTLLQRKLHPNALYQHDSNQLYGEAREVAVDAAFEAFERRLKRLTPEEREANRVKLCSLLAKYSKKPIGSRKAK
ncbi:MAG: hypothetical protein Q7R64_03665 [bacterium]|nr:hypothetical protein [bacterium]